MQFSVQFRVRGLIFGGACIRRGLFSKFYGIQKNKREIKQAIQQTNKQTDRQTGVEWQAGRPTGSQTQKQTYTKHQHPRNDSFTPWYVRVSSKNVRIVFYDGNGISFSIAPTVKGTGSPTMQGGAVT